MCAGVCVEGKVVSVCTGVSLYVNRCVSPCVHRCVCVGGEVVSVCRCVWGECNGVCVATCVWCVCGVCVCGVCV